MPSFFPITDRVCTGNRREELYSAAETTLKGGHTGKNYSGLMMRRRRRGRSRFEWLGKAKNTKSYILDHYFPHYYWAHLLPSKSCFSLYRPSLPERKMGRERSLSGVSQIRGKKKEGKGCVCTRRAHAAPRMGHKKKRKIGARSQGKEQRRCLPSPVQPSPPSPRANFRQESEEGGEVGRRGYKQRAERGVEWSFSF